MRPLHDRIGIVTGASSGIGAATARALAADGMTVVLAARRLDRLTEVADAIRTDGGTAEVAEFDLRDEAAIDALVDGTVQRHGRLDALVNNAAMGVLRRIEDGVTAEWRAVLETNVLGTLAACRAALRHMLPRGRGDLVNMTSVSAFEAWPHLGVYAGSKAAVHAFSNSLRAEVGGRGIRVMTMQVHGIATEFAAAIDPDEQATAAARWEALGQLNREAEVIDPAHVGRTIAFMPAQPPNVSLHDVTLRPRNN
jgi:NADP-dependent 3-hydroxy acid dehydrogenase YdfG